MRALLFCLSVAGIAYSNLAQAGPSETPQEGTIRDLLAACLSNDTTIVHEKCDRQFGSMFLVIGMAETAVSPHEPDLCFPLRDYKDAMDAFRAYKSAMLDWFRAHPETLELGEFEGMKRGTVFLYACQQK